MKDNKFQNAIKDIRQIGMNQAERRDMLESILNKKIAQQNVASPFGLFSFSVWIRKSTVIGSFVLIAVVILGGKLTISSADMSLPGDPLYPIKVDIIEPIRGRFISSVENKARYEADLASIRLVEAEALAIQGKLEPHIEENIISSVSEHSQALNDILNDQNNGIPSGNADTIRVNFNAKVDAHSRLLRTISTNTNKKEFRERSIAGSENTDTAKSSSESVLMSAPQNVAGERIQTNLESRSRTVGVSTSIRNNQDEDYIKKKEQLSQMISSVSVSMDQNSSSTAPFMKSIMNETQETLNEAHRSLEKARQASDSGDFEKARSLLLEYEKKAKEASIYLNSGIDVNEHAIKNDYRSYVKDEREKKDDMYEKKQDEMRTEDTKSEAD